MCAKKVQKEFGGQHCVRRLASLTMKLGRMVFFYFVQFCATKKGNRQSMEMNNRCRTQS